jgi:hypothetical protein
MLNLSSAVVEEFFFTRKALNLGAVERCAR